MVTSRRQSHRITIQAAPEPVIRQGRLSLIDLAGSERAAATLNTGTRLREGANINKSLLALANCINALSNGSERVKYRDSKLTHLLKSSLEGDCHVAMLAAVTPSHKSYEESHNTLKYAHRAKNIKSNVQVQPQAPSLPLAPQIASTALKMIASIATGSTPKKTEPPHQHHQERQTLATLDENIPSATKKKTVTTNNSQQLHFPPFYHGGSSHPSSAASSPASSPVVPREPEQPPHVNRHLATIPSNTSSGHQEGPKLEQVLMVVQYERDRLQEERDELRAELLKAKETIANLRRSSISMAAAQFQPMPPMSTNARAAPPVPAKMSTGNNANSAPTLPPRRASSRLRKPTATSVE